MRGFEIERTLDEDTCSMETLPEKILKVPGIALVAAGTPACLIGLYDSAARINSLDRLFLCQISSESLQNAFQFSLSGADIF